MKSLHVWWLILAAAIAVLPGCGDDSEPTGTGGQPPPVPPAATVSPDLALFTSPLALELAGVAGAPSDTFGQCDTTMWNFANAAVRVVPVTAGVAAIVVPAAAALAGAAGVTPTLEDGGWFVYGYTISYEGYAVDLELRAKWDRANDAIDYEMYATTELWSHAVEGWLWYTGECAEDLTEGIWTFHVPALEDTVLVSKPFVETDWEWNSATDMTALFTIVAPDTAIHDDTIEYDRLGTWIQMEVHDASPSLSGVASWDLETQGGWLQFPNYREGARACWSESGCDMACPHY